MGEQTLFNPRNIFISWNHKDRGVKDQVCSFIREGGYTVWESDLECAGSITEVCLGNIAFCDVFLIILTENSLKSQWVRAEFEEALKLPDAKRRILPLIIGGEAVIKETESFFSDISYIHILSAFVLPDIKKKLLTSVTYLVLDHCFTVYRNSFLHESIRVPFYGKHAGSVNSADFDKSAYAVKRDADLTGLYISRKLYELTDFQHSGVIQSEEELLETEGNIVIIGESGCGKSQYMRRFAAAAARQADYLVFLISCGTFVRSGLTLTEYLYMQFKQRTGSGNYTEGQFYALLKVKEKRVVVLMDGVDEIIEETPRMLQKTMDFGEQYPALRFIFTTRSRKDADQIRSYGIKVKQYELHNFEEEEAEDFITRLFAAFHESDRKEAFCRELDTVGVGEQIRSNPLLLGQLVLLYLSSGSIPDTETKIFDLATEILVNDIDKEHDIFDSFMGEERSLVKHALPDVLKKMAYEKCLDKSKSRLSENEEIVAEILCADYGYQERKGDALAAAGKIIVYLQRRYILAGSEFSHKMWLEYYAAVWLYDAAYRRGKLADRKLLDHYFAEHYRERYWEKITELFLCRADDKFVLADGSIDRQRYEELYDIILSANRGDYGLLFRAGRRWRSCAYVCSLLVRDIAVKTVRGKLQAYGQLFCYIPREKLYGLLLAVANDLCPLLSGQERFILLSLVRDVCYIYGGFVSAGQVEGETQASAGLADYASRYGASPRAALNGMFYKAALPWLDGYIKEQENSRVYPFCFNVHAVSVCDGTGFGEYELDEVFEDELSLYQETPCGKDRRFIGLVSVPYRWKEMCRSFYPGFYSDMTGLILLPSEETLFERSPVMLDRVQVLYLPGSIREYKKYSLAGLGMETDGVRISIAYGIVWDILEIKRESEFAYSGMQHIGTVNSMFLPKSDMEIPKGLYRNNQTVTHFPFHGNYLRLDKEVFQDCKELRIAEIPSGIRSIGDRVFQGCDRLESVTIPESVHYIGEQAFAGCTSLTDIVLPGVSTIGAAAFQDCFGLRSVTILANIERIGRNTFAGCRNLEELHLPTGLEEIAEDAFKDCRNLKTVLIGEEKWEVYYDEKNEQACLKGKEGVEEKYYDEKSERVRLKEKEEVEEKKIEENEIENEKLRLKYKIFRTLREEYAWRESENDFMEFPEGTTVVSSGSCKGLFNLRRVFLPESVTEIGEKAFYGCMGLLDIHIPRGVTRIGYQAFAGCFDLAEIEIPDTVEQIARDAFNGCASITKLRIPDSVQKIEYGAFANCCGLEEVILGNGLKAIEREVFGNCYSLTSLILPNGIIEIKERAFLGCRSLESLDIPEGVVKIESEVFHGCKRLAHITIPGSVEELEGKVFLGCEGLKAVDLSKGPFKMGIGVFDYCQALSEVRLPERMVQIEDDTFRSCHSLETVELPEGMIRIGHNAFSECIRLRNIEIPRTVEEIGYGAFSGCKELTSVRLPNGLTEVAGRTFFECSSLEEIEIPETVKTIEGGAFFRCPKLRMVRIPNGIAEIGARAFSECVRLVEIRLPDSVIKIEEEAFCGCSGLTEVGLSAGITELNESIFEDCVSLEQVRIPEGVKRIGKEAFKNCESLSEIIMPRGAMEIGSSAFAGCRQLLEIALPEGLTEIAEEAFEDCSSLQSIGLPECMKGIGRRAFANCQCLREIALPEGIKRIGDYSFKGCSGLKSIELPKSVEEIGNYAFSDCSSLERIELPESIKKIGKKAFSNCTSLREIVLPEKITEIESGAFSGCSSLERIELSESIKKIGGSAFSNCTSLREIVLPEKITEIESGAFSGCSSLERIELSESIKKIGGSAFSNCTSLREIVLPEKITEIESGAFFGCSSLERIELSESIKKIGGSAFSNCTSLREIVLPEGLEYMGGDVFADCVNLRHVVIPDSVKQIGSGAFLNCASLSEIVIPRSVVEIQEKTFSGCCSLQAVKLPEHLSEIGVGAFRNCSALVAFEFPKELTIIREETFFGCTALKELYIPAWVDQIRFGAFDGCRLSKVAIHKKFQGILYTLFGNVIGCTQHPDEPELIMAEFESL